MKILNYFMIGTCYFFVAFFPIWIGFIIWEHYQNFPFIPSVDLVFIPLLIICVIIGMGGCLIFAEIFKAYGRLVFGK